MQPLGVGIEGFHCILRYPYLKRGGIVYRGVPISGGWVPLYTEVSSFQGDCLMTTN